MTLTFKHLKEILEYKRAYVVFHNNDLYYWGGWKGIKYDAIRKDISSSIIPNDNDIRLNSININLLLDSLLCN